MTLYASPLTGADRFATTEAPSPIPQHVAIIMDGNGRWAEQRSLPRPIGHREGVKAVRRAVKACQERGVEVLTLFAFSSENWQRPALEVNFLMELFRTTLRSELQRLHDTNVRLRCIGDRSIFPPKLQFYVTQAEAHTARNTGLTLVIAANYGGRWDILQAAAKIAKRDKLPSVSATPASWEHFEPYLCLHDLPAPALLIRTGGEQRLSNFLLWQLAYTELYFTPQLWPDFGAADLDLAFADFAKRQRRFGKTSEQLERNV